MMYEIIVIGVSLGGLRTLQTLLSGLPADFMLPMVIVQHRGSQGGEGLVPHLQKRSPIMIREPEDKERILSGRVYLAPAGYHLMVDRNSFSLSTDAPVSYATPSIDVLFDSAADSFGRHTLGLLLSGANHDGTEGLGRIKSVGGHTLVQDPSTAACPVMPQKAIDEGVVDRVLPLADIAAYLTTFNPSYKLLHAQSS